MWDAISTGAVDAGWYSPGFAQGIIPSASHYQDVWDGLEEQERFAIRTSCAANVTYTMAEGEAKQLEPLADLQAEVVTVHTWNDEMMSAFRGASDEVAIEQSKEDADFARAWKSLSDFRANFAKWADLAYTK